ncbi:HAD family hydrolase [Candidatus Daviesbacteria bacterium]|nr:HAD family hydrolase [Candidatus Daviesbacteria bacterium]
MKIDANKYRSIISDYDGTLVGSDFLISESTKLAIDKWRSSGKFFSIATAKAFNGVIEKACDFLDLTDPVITHNGAQIINPKTKEIINAEYIPNNEVLKIIDILSKTGYLYEVQTKDEAYASSNNLQKLQTHKKYEIISSLKINKIFKVRLVTTLNDQPKVEQFVKKLKIEFDNLQIIPGDTPYSKGFDITSEKATKHLAVLLLAEFLGIQPKEIIGIGDSLNDYPLLTACGFKVAMKNAPKEILEIADYTIEDYRNDGVAKFINIVLRS